MVHLVSYPRALGDSELSSQFKWEELVSGVTVRYHHCPWDTADKKLKGRQAKARESRDPKLATVE